MSYSAGSRVHCPQHPPRNPPNSGIPGGSILGFGGLLGTSHPLGTIRHFKLRTPLQHLLARLSCPSSPPTQALPGYFNPAGKPQLTTAPLKPAPALCSSLSCQVAWDLASCHKGRSGYRAGPASSLTHSQQVGYSSHHPSVLATCTWPLSSDVQSPVHCAS